MNISRSFILVGAAFLIIGVSFGIFMGGSGDHTFAPLHAHINLLGFTLMTVFGVLYRVFPETGLSNLARLHFWLHLGGTTLLLVMLFLFFSERITPEAMFPLAPIAEVLVMAGILTYAYNILTNLK
jgi:hypothetical protein